MNELIRPRHHSTNPVTEISAMFPGTFSPRALFLGCLVALSAVIFVVYLESGHVGFGHSTSPVESRLQCLAQKSVELCL